MKKIISGLKWMIKKIFLFFSHPILTIDNNFDFEYINTFLYNKNIIKSNLNKYNNLDDSFVSVHNFHKETELSKSSSLQLQLSINPDYFTNLNHYGYGYKILVDAKYRNLNFLDGFHLYPANVFVINETIKLIQNGLIKEGLIVDFPSGIGNLFIYLDRFYDKNKFVGIDNFEQISKAEVLKYQKGIGYLAKTKTFQEFKHEFGNYEVDLLISIELNLDLIIDEIMEIGSEFLIFETMYVSRYKHLTDIITSKYDVYCLNESIITYRKRKNL